MLSRCLMMSVTLSIYCFWQYFVNVTHTEKLPLSPNSHHYVLFRLAYLHLSSTSSNGDVMVVHISTAKYIVNGERIKRYICTCCIICNSDVSGSFTSTSTAPTVKLTFLANVGHFPPNICPPPPQKTRCRTFAPPWKEGRTFAPPRKRVGGH